MSDTHYRLELYGGRLDGTVMQLPYGSTGYPEPLVNFPNMDFSQDWYQLCGTQRWNDCGPGLEALPRGFWWFLSAARHAATEGMKLNYQHIATTAAGEQLKLKRPA